MKSNGKYRAEFYFKNGVIDRRRECLKILSNTLPDSKLISYSMRGGVMYVAVEMNGKIGAVVIVTSVRKKELMNFQYTLYHENDLPVYFNCDNSLLELLDETENENAKVWRQRCRELNQLKREVLALDMLPVGTKISVKWNGGIRELTKSIVPPLKTPIWYDGYFKYDSISVQRKGYTINEH